MSKNNGGPAFPYSALVPDNRTGTVTPTMYEDSNGMSLRDYFAAKAMQGCLATFGDGEAPTSSIAIARYAYEVADAMLEARDE